MKAADSGIVFDEDFNERVRITVADDSPISSVDLNGYYDPYYGSSFWKESAVQLVDRTRTTDENGETVYNYTYVVGIYQHGVASEAPERYFVNATDAKNNGLSLHVDPQQGQLVSAVSVAATSVIAGAPAVGGVGGTTTGSGIAATVGGVSAGTAAVASGVVVAVGSAAVWAYDQRPAGSVDSEIVAGATSYAVPATSVNERPLETPEGVEITLPSGAVYEDPPVPIDGGHERGFGEENVYRLPGLNDRSDLQYVIDHPSVHDQRGPYEIVIGDNPNGPGQIELWLLADVLIAAYAFEPLNSPAIEKDVILDEDYYDEHIEHQDDHLNEEQIREVVENPDMIYSNGEDYAWVKVVNGVYHYVRGTDLDVKHPNAPASGIHVRTAYTNTKQKLQELIKRSGLDQIYQQ